MDLKKFDFNVVIYDEVENFKDYDSSLFNYPYDNRKNIIDTLTLNANASLVS